VVGSPSTAPNQTTLPAARRSPPFRRRRLLALAAMALAVGAFVAFLAGGRQPEPDANAATRGPGSPFTLTWGGDVTLGSRYGNPPDHAREMLAAVAPIMREADIAAVNLEGTLGAGGTSKCPPPPNASSNCFAFQAPAENAEALPGAGVDIVNLANNHAWDFGAAGQVQTLRALRRAGMVATGRPGQITIVRRGGLRIALLGFAAYPWAASLTDLGGVRRLVRRAGAAADVVVVAMHAGSEGADQTRVPGGTEVAFGEDRGDSRRFAHAAVDAGADLVVGSGPHVIRGIERYHRRVIAYSLGNFAGWNNFGMGGTLSESGILRVKLNADGVPISTHWIPIQLTGPGIPEIDHSGESKRLVERLSRADFGRAAGIMPDA
jgi:Bacterial capsule synthesis protein PGA_cap